jgi:hypothetical protein
MAKKKASKQARLEGMAPTTNKEVTAKAEQYAELLHSWQSTQKAAEAAKAELHDLMREHEVWEIETDDDEIKRVVIEAKEKIKVSKKKELE